MSSFRFNFSSFESILIFSPVQPPGYFFHFLLFLVLGEAVILHVKRLVFRAQVQV